MSSLELKLRMSSSWQARWVAGLFSLLLVTAGIAPANTPDSADSFRQTFGQSFGESIAESHGGIRSGPPLSTADEGRATSRDVCALAGDGLGSRSTSDPDIEEYEPDLSASPAFQLTLFAGATDRFAPIDAGSPNGLDASGRPSPRAPPLA